MYNEIQQNKKKQTQGKTGESNAYVSFQREERRQD
jgi:hypothetical protein